MPKIHPTAIIEGDVTLADDVEIGPRCTITGPVTIGPGTRTIGDVWINGRTTIGAGCTIYPFTTIGFSPQSRGYDRERIGPGVATPPHRCPFAIIIIAFFILSNWAVSYLLLPWLAGFPP